MCCRGRHAWAKGLLIEVDETPIGDVCGSWKGMRRRLTGASEGAGVFAEGIRAEELFGAVCGGV